jgi:hypothetical protein
MWSQAKTAFVRESSPFWTLETVSYPFENTRISDINRQDHFWTP